MFTIMMGRSRGPHILVCVDNHQLPVPAPLLGPFRCTEDSGHGDDQPPNTNWERHRSDKKLSSKYIHKLMQRKDLIEKEQGSFICSDHGHTLNMIRDIVAA